jgi:6,7-dimethyl-8-ribityllumazine synthase
MPKIVEGQLVIKKGTKFGIVVSRFNALITERLVEAAIDCIVRHGGDANEITIVRVPGAYELPLAVQSLCNAGAHDALIALGCVIRGGTPHFDYVASEATKGLSSASLDSGIPVAFGVLTCDNLEQALERAGAKGGNKGWEAAASAIEMVDLLGKINKK